MARPYNCALLCLFFLFSTTSTLAWSELPDALFRPDPSGIIVQDGTYVMNVGEAHVHITNTGLIGSAPGSLAPFSDAPSCQWPAGSGEEYLYTAGLWVGGIVLGEPLVSTGGAASEWKPLAGLEYTIYEAVEGQQVRPPGNPLASGRRLPDPAPDDDEDGLIDEEILNGFDDDGDGLIDEDFGQIGNQMMVVTTVDNTQLAREQYPDHQPMNLRMVQSSFQWDNDQVDDFVGFDYRVTNIGVTDVERVYIGFFADSDIGSRDGGADIFQDDMAGSWSGSVRASDGSWVPVEVGYMWDGAQDNALDGFFGILFLGHDVDPSGRRAPIRVGLRTFQRFSNLASFEQGGDPTNDDQRYQLLSAAPEDWDPVATREADYRFLVSAGPFEVLEPGQELNFQVGMVMGAGLGSMDGDSGLLGNCAEAALTFYGVHTDTIPPQPSQDDPDIMIETGILGRETMLCREDFETDGGGQNPFDLLVPDVGDTSCVSPMWLLNQATIADEEIFLYSFGPGDVRHCAMFNLDNCFECARQLGPGCTRNSIASGQWNCNNPQAGDRSGCTGIEGSETRIPWLVGMAPPPPGMRIWAGDSRVHVFWDDRSERTPDVRLQTVDFESYRVWRADNWDRPFGTSLANGPAAELWQLLAEFDQVNNYVSIREIPGQPAVLDTMPLGANTGLEVVRYQPRCLEDARFTGLAAAMQDLVEAMPGAVSRVRPAVRGADGRVLPGRQNLVPWETYPDVLDTFFAVTARAGDAAAGIDPKVPTRYYEYVDRDIHNGFIYFYAVSATDHALLPAGSDEINLPRGPGLAGNPGSSFQHTVPGTEAQTAAERGRDGTNIYVYPNPASRDALQEYQQLYPNDGDPTGVRVTFTNLPASRNRIRIYTLAGDLVQTLEHDGSRGMGHASWNLVSRNQQEVVSGIYLYVVSSEDGRFEDFVGKFVVIR